MADPGAAIDPRTGMGPVHLTVADLARSTVFYEQTLGLEARRRDRARVELGTPASTLVVVVEEPGARPAPAHTGLFHLALLLPDRAALARWLRRAVEQRIALEGLSDHAVSEAVYLRDPDGHGIEVYADRPRALWDGRVGQLLTTRQLDVGDLLATLNGDSSPSEGSGDETVVGHVHLQVADLSAAVSFYRDVLGFGLLAQLGVHAGFLGAGGYHHHVGVNTWASLGASPPPPGAAALRHLTVLLPDQRARDETLARLAAAGHRPETGEQGPLVRDPSENAIVLVVA